MLNEEIAERALRLMESWNFKHWESEAERRCAFWNVYDGLRYGYPECCVTWHTLMWTPLASIANVRPEDHDFEEEDEIDYHSFEQGACAVVPKLGELNSLFWRYRLWLNDHCKTNNVDHLPCVRCLLEKRVVAERNGEADKATYEELSAYYNKAQAVNV